jgi:hypothetical protein
MVVEVPGQEAMPQPILEAWDADSDIDSLRVSLLLGISSSPAPGREEAHHLVQVL